MTVALSPRVLELIVSRVCHDLVSPVGAISNGVELMEELGGGTEALSLISSSAHQAGLRLKFFRLAYGAAGTDKNMGFKDVKEVFNGWLQASAGGNVKASFDENLALKFSMPPKGFLKTLLNLLALAAECTHGNGSISVSALEGKNGVKILTTGAKIKFRDSSDLALEGKVSEEDLDPRLVHAYLSGKLVDYFGFSLSKVSDQNEALLSIELSF